MIWDAIVVGAGPAGCAAAYDLAAAGHRVLLVDKARFPRPKACAGGLTAKAVKALRYSIDPVVRHTVREIHLEHRSAPGGVLAIRRSKPVCAMTVRSELDAYCLDQTCRRGAVFRRIGPILSLREEADRVLLRLEGEPDPLIGRLLLGADGVHSRVRALVGEAAWFRTGFALEANVPYSVTGRTFPLVFDFAPVAGGYGWLFPRNDHVNVGLYSAGPAMAPEPAVDDSGMPGTRSCSAPARVDPAPIIDRALLADYIAARCGTREHDRAAGQFLGMGASGYTPSASRILLAGDAAGFVDPLTGEGIHGAIASGQAAAAAMLGHLRRGGDAAGLYTAKLSRLRADLAVAERAARRFYARPERGFRLMQLPLVRQAVLHSYSEGVSLGALAFGIGVVRRLAGSSQPVEPHQ
jgi:geranylgeranyl reductase family protein